MKKNDPMGLALDASLRIAHRSTESDGRARWTEISVFHLPVGMFGGKRWVSQVEGHSLVKDERMKRRRLASSHLERALQLIDPETDIGLIVIEEAREWAETHGIVGRNIRGQKVPEHPADGLRWLFGDDLLDDDSDREAVAKVLGLALSDVHDTLDGHLPTLTVDITKLLPFVDREAFMSATDPWEQKGPLRG